MKMKPLIAIAAIIAVIVIAAAIYIRYIGKMSILDKYGMVYEEPSVSQKANDV